MKIPQFNYFYYLFETINIFNKLIYIIVMNYKILSIFVIIITLLTTSYGCVYMEDHNSCDFITNQGSNIISVDISSLGEYKEINARIIFLNGDVSELKYLDTMSTPSQATFYQSRQLEEFGVYDLEISATLQDGISQVSRSFTLLYDNSQPLAPVVESVHSSSDTLRIEGFVNYPSLGGEIITFVNGEEVSTDSVSSTGAFRVVVPKNLVNRLELFHRINFNGEQRESSRTKLMHYSQELKDELFSNVNIARINSVNFISDNPLTYEESSKITTFTPHYHISGTASQGNVVFIQGVPVPVINGEFQTYILLNEGKENVCVIGQNTQCQLVNTIYSHANPQTLFSLANKEDILDLDLDNLDDSSLVYKLLVQGKDSTLVDLSPQVSLIERNLFLIESLYPGLYEREYVLIDTQDPQIEILTFDTLFRGSRIGVILKDDTRIDLSSFSLTVGSTTLSIEDAIVASTQRQVSYLEFEVPSISSTVPLTITSSLRDVEGNPAIARREVSSIESTPSSPKLTFELLGQGKLIGNRIYINSDIDTIQLKVSNENSQKEIVPITTNLIQLGNEIINSFSINSNNELIIEVDVSDIRTLTQLKVGLNIFNSVSSQSLFSQPEMTFEIYPIGRTLESSKTHRVVASDVSQDNEVIVELLSKYIDFSSIRVSNRASFRVNGNYVFIDLKGSPTSTVSYNDLSGASYTFQITAQDNRDVSINYPSNQQNYQTLRVNSQRNTHFLDLYSSSRSSQSLSHITSNENIHFNSHYLEGLSRSLISLYEPSKRNTVVSNVPIQETFTFSSYPSMQVPLFEGIGEVFYRGKLQYVPQGQSRVIVQGRILGNEQVSEVRLNGVLCSTRQRFFVCDLARDDYVGEELELRFYNSNGVEVPIAHNSLLIRGPSSTMNFGTLKNVEIQLQGEFISNKGSGNVYREDVTQLITCQDNSNTQSYTHQLLPTGKLSISKTSSDLVGVEIECELKYKNLFTSSTINGIFLEDGTSSFTIPENEEQDVLFTQFPSKVLNMGSSMGTTLYLNAQHTTGADVTSNVVCNSARTNVKLNPISGQNLNENGKLEITRVSNNSFTSFISCSLQDDSEKTFKIFEVNFDKISNNHIVDDISRINLNLDTELSNLLTTNEPFAFSRGDLVFRIEPNVAGSYRLYMNGELVKTIQYPNIEITLNQEDYFNLGLSGEFDVEVRDEVSTSNTITMRFVRVLGAIVSIIIS